MPIEQQPRGPNGDARQTGDGGNRESLAANARGAGEKTMAQAQDRAETGKNRAAEGVDHATDAVRDAAERLQQQEPWLADMVSRGADELAQLADTLRTNDLRSMLSRTEELSRRQPMLVAGAAFAAGFAAMRAARSAAAPAAAGLSDVAGDAVAKARREGDHAMAGAQQAARDVSGNRPEQQQSGSRGNTAAEAGRTGLGH